jgi:hypothetical protein
VKNQPSPSLISLSPLIVSHPRALRRAWVRSSGLTPVNLLTIRSLGFGCDPTRTRRIRPTCWPIIQKVRGCPRRQSTVCSFKYFNAFHTWRWTGLFQLSFTVLVFYHSPHKLRFGARSPCSTKWSSPTYTRSELPLGFSIKKHFRLSVAPIFCVARACCFPPPSLAATGKEALLCFSAAKKMFQLAAFVTLD